MKILAQSLYPIAQVENNKKQQQHKQKQKQKQQDVVKGQKKG